MQHLVMKIKAALKRIEQEKGPFKVKSLVAKDAANMPWDLVLSADWFEADLIKRLDYLSEKILSDFDIDCMVQFSGIVTFDAQTTNPLLEMLLAIQENHKLGKYNDLGQGYIVVESHQEAAKWIIPLNDPKPV